MQEFQPIVTIVCTTYNHEKYIADCFEGFLSQRTNFKYEILVHDDASKDNSASLIREYEHKYPDVFRVICQTENQYSKGVNIWFDILFPMAKGKYIAICEGDDYWIDPLKLQKQVDFMEDHPDYSMCYHNAVSLYVQAHRLHAFDGTLESYDLSFYDAVHSWRVPTASILFRKKGFKYPEWLDVIYSGDYSLILICSLLGKIHSIGGIRSVYRINTEGTSATARLKDKGIFILSQKKKLLESFNKGTNYKFKEIVDSKIEELNQEISFQKKKNKSLLLCIIDKLFYKKIRKKISSLFNEQIP